MRIVIVGKFPRGDNFPRGGIEASTAGLAAGVRQQYRDWRVDVVDVDSVGRSRRDERYSVTYLGRSGWHRYLVPFNGLRALHAILRLRPQLCNLHAGGRLTAWLCIGLRLARVPVCLTVHGIQRKETWNRLKRQRSIKNMLQFVYYTLSEALALRVANGVIVDTPYVAEQLGLREGARLAVIPQGAFYEPGCQVKETEQDLLVTVAVFGRRKGHHFALRAVKQLVGEFPGLRYLVFGAAADKEYISELEALIAQLDLSNHVTLVKDAPAEELRRNLERARVFLLHSEEESQGIAMCEAMLAGVPVVATAVAAIPHVVPHGRAGLLSPFGNVDEFARNVASILRDDALHARLSHGGREWAAQYRWSAVTERVVRYFERIAER